MTETPLSILHVSTADRGGGAEKCAWDLFQSSRARGQDAWLAVGRKRTEDPNVLEIPHAEASPPWAQFWWQVSRRQEAAGPGGRAAAWLARRLAEPLVAPAVALGVENFHFPGSHRLLSLPPRSPDVVHCHNLHGDYFDLRYLPALSRARPVFLTLHDTWLLSGHCAYSLDCQRWKIGCGQCPYLSIPPAVPRDATAYNWRRKQRIYRRSRLYLAAPSRWIKDEVEQSMLAPAAAEMRVLPYGIDLTTFRPGRKAAARAALSLPQDTPALLFLAHGGRHNPYKDYETVEAAVTRLAARQTGRRLLLLAVGAGGTDQILENADIRFLPFVKDPAELARYYQAADVFLHAARADNFPFVVLEALACGTPVVATAVGGIPEQVRGLEADTPTGVLVPPHDPEAMADAVEKLLADDALRTRLGENAAQDAARRFDLNRQTDDYLTWYREILDREILAREAAHP